MTIKHYYPKDRFFRIQYDILQKVDKSISLKNTYNENVLRLISNTLCRDKLYNIRSI